MRKHYLSNENPVWFQTFVSKSFLTRSFCGKDILISLLTLPPGFDPEYECLWHTATTIGARPGSSWLRSRFCLDKYSPLKNIHTWKIFIPEKYSPLIMHKIGFSTQNMNVFDTSPPPSEPGQGHQWLRSWFCLDRHKYSLFHSIVDFQANIFFPHTRTPMMVTWSRFFKKSVLLFRAESERLAAERLLEEAKSLIEVQKKALCCETSKKEAH